MRWLLGRLGGLLLVVWGAATAGFLALTLIPGDPVEVMLGVQAQVSEQLKAQIRADWGLDDPPIARYLQYLGRLATGDLGESYQLRQPVSSVIGQQLPATLQLTALALAFALVLATIATLAARGRRSTRIVSLVELTAVSSPTFWTGLVLIAVFVFQVGWFPIAETGSLRALVLPALTLALPVAGVISQVLRQGLDAASARPFATTAIARGIGGGRLLLRHTLRHAAADSVTLVGYLVGTLIGGAVLVETVFARPGLGRVTLRAIIDRDLPVVLGIILLAAVTFALINLVVDVLYRWIDPRLRTGSVAT
ncbi:MAG: ABC transporter permease [Microbacteriaceae bacterium]|nr:ABC transporter permease [Microbacteriaceae bacterium]